MHKTKPTAVLVALTVLAGAPLAAQAQTAPSPTSPPPASRPETTPMPPAPAEPGAAAQRQVRLFPGAGQPADRPGSFLG